MRVAVVGAGGFIGRSLVSRLNSEGHDVMPVVRAPAGLVGEKAISDINGADWLALLDGIEVVVHLAARVHMMSDTVQDPLTEFRRVNTLGTASIADAAAHVGVRRFVFLSSIKVNGEATRPGRPFRHDDPPAPTDPYGISKAEAERVLFALAQSRGIEAAVIRPPMVYGTGVKGNFRSLMSLVGRGIPLPLRSITRNRRSLVGVDNLTSLISTTLDHPSAANATFLVADGEDVSTARLLDLIAHAMGKRSRLMPMPAGALSLFAALAGKKEEAARLIGNLQVDICSTRERLDWVPPMSLSAGIQAAVSDALPA